MTNSNNLLSAQKKWTSINRLFDISSLLGSNTVPTQPISKPTFLALEGDSSNLVTDRNTHLSVLLRSSTPYSVECTDVFLSDILDNIQLTPMVQYVNTIVNNFLVIDPTPEIVNTDLIPVLLLEKPSLDNCIYVEAITGAVFDSLYSKPIFLTQDIITSPIISLENLGGVIQILDREDVTYIGLPLY